MQFQPSKCLMRQITKVIPNIYMYTYHTCINCVTSNSVTLTFVRKIGTNL